MDANSAVHLTSPQRRSSEAMHVGQVLVFKPASLMSAGLNAPVPVTLGTGFPAFSSSRVGVFLPLNLRFRKLAWNEEDTDVHLTKPELCMPLNSLQRVEFFIVACHNLL